MLKYFYFIQTSSIISLEKDSDDIYIPSFVLPSKYKTDLYKYMQNNQNPFATIRYYDDNINSNYLYSPLFITKMIPYLNDTFKYKEYKQYTYYLISISKNRL